MTPATMAAMIAVEPFSIPASADETRCSANGNSDSGKASQMRLSAAIGQPSPGASGRRTPGTSESVRKPMSRRTKVTPSGAIASSPSAMNRNDAPQITPGTTSSARSSMSVRDMLLTMTQQTD